MAAETAALDDRLSAVKCPECGTDDDRVVDSRPAEDGAAIRRRRECNACTTRFTTFERLELSPLLVRKRSGAALPFDRAKVLDGMARASKGRIDHDVLVGAAAAVEANLRAVGRREVTSEMVGIEVLGQLRGHDTVAYMRFASVYKDFQEAEDFEAELSSLRKAAPPKDLDAVGGTVVDEAVDVVTRPAPPMQRH